MNKTFDSCLAQSYWARGLQGPRGLGAPSLASCRFKLPESFLAAMVLRSPLKFADECLDDPLRSRAKSLLSCFSCQKEVIQMPDSLRLTGVVATMSFPQVDLAPLWFAPKMGFHQDDRAHILDIKFQEMGLCSCTLWLRGFGPVFARPCLPDVVLRPSGLDHCFDIASDCMGVSWPLVGDAWAKR